MKIRLLLLILPLLGGCSLSPSATVLHELAGAPNALCLIITTPWGGSTLDRNHACAGNAGAASTPIVIVTPGGAAPAQVQVVK